MKKIILVSLGLFFCPASIFAADLSSIKASPHPPSQSTWEGLFIGVNGGGQLSNNSNVSFSAWPINDYATNPSFWAPLNRNFDASGKSGFIGGGQIGYNWQETFMGLSIVEGLEADIQAPTSAGSSRSSTFFSPGPSNAGPFVGSAPVTDNIWSNTSYSTHLNYLGTVRSNLGLLATPTLLIYGTGGLAYGSLSTTLRQTQLYNYTTLQNPSSTGGFVAASSANNSMPLIGYAAGGGAEWMLMPRWSVRAEYLYYSLENHSITSVTNSISTGSNSIKPWMASTAMGNVSGNIIRAGINYHFDMSGGLRVIE